MNYPHTCRFKVDKIHGSKEVIITLYSGITVFVGPNAAGKTQTLKALRNYLKAAPNNKKVRYLSSNRIGNMESYRSKVNHLSYSPDNYNVGSQDDKRQRIQIETATGDFFTMDEKKDVFIKVAERLSVLFKRQVYLRWDSGNLKVFFEKTETQTEYSVVVEASGLVNVISILAALFDKDVEVLFIDEPEVSLHPQLQSYLLREMKKAANEYGKTIILSTHSPEMISFNSIADISNYVFFSEKELPVQIAPNTPELENRKLKDFIMRISQIYKTGFFAKKILLIEGASDLIMCKFLLQKLDLNIDVAGSQIIPVEGKGQFPVIAKLFRLINKEVSILTDLDGFTDDNTVIDLFCSLPAATKVANTYGYANLSEMVRGIKSQLFDLIAANQENLASIYEIHPYWINKKSTDDTTKIIRRAVTAQLYNTTPESLLEWPNSPDWNSLQVRMNTLFTILETLGCFVLRKGAIESYYQFVPNTAYDEKPSSAAEETSELQVQSEEFICEHYGDILRSLKYIALTEKVDESFAVKKELLSELALVLGILPKKANVKELLAAIKQAKGSSVSLFNYEIIEENNVRGVNVSLKSSILEVSGFPFKIFCGQNVNDIVDLTIHTV